MGIIIAAHAGTGKTHFARENPQIAVDSTYFRYRYDVPEDCLISSSDDAEGEAAKASFMFPGNREYPQNYIDAIKSAVSERKFIFIVPADSVLDGLSKDLMWNFTMAA